MLSQFIRVIALQILIEIGRRAAGIITSSSSPVPPALQELVEAYWDWAYIYKYGLPKIVDIVIEGPSPFSSQGRPDPSSMPGSLIRDSLLIDVIDLAIGDPHPQPNSWIQVLGNKQIRMTSAKKLRDHFKKAIPQLGAEAKRLEKLP